MQTTRQKFAFILAFCAATSAAYGKKDGERNSFRRSTSELAQTTAQHAQGAICAAAQGLDHLAYPALGLLVGKVVWEKASPLAPERVRSVTRKVRPFEQEYVPGGSRIRHLLTYAVVGGMVCASVNYLSNVDGINRFLSKNMPHVSALLQHLKTEFSYSANTRKRTV